MPTVSKNQVKIVLFEDNDALREVLFQLINDSEGLDCVGAFSDAENVLEHLRQTEASFVIMDIDLPGMNGIDSTRILKASFPDMPVLMLTIFEDDAKIFNAICAGANGYLLKNSTPNQIIQSIREMVHGGAPMSPMVARKVLESYKANNGATRNKTYDLSQREREILELITKGMSYKMVSETCNISIDTVKFHAKNIYEKLQVHSKSEAIVLAIRNRIV